MFDAAASQPHREAVVVMVATVAAFRDWRATELAAPHDQRFVEQAAAFQVAKQRRDRLLDLTAEAGDRLVDVLVMVSAAEFDVDVATAAFHQPTRNQAASREGTRSVFLVSRLRFRADVKHVPRGELHSKGGLHRADSSVGPSFRDLSRRC